MTENVSHPHHYSRLSPEPIDLIRDWNLNHNLGCVVKYIARAGHKDPTKHIEDLRKAAFYLNHEISTLENHNDDNC